MLSKPAMVLSLGSSAETSTSRSSRSRIAFAYSLRFMRCTDGDPGFGWSAACAIQSGFEPRGETVECGPVGTRAFLGGIMPVRSLRTTASQATTSFSR